MHLNHLLSFQTPRGPLRWPVLIALILLTLTVLWLVWATAESQLAQWVVITASLMVWNVLAIRAGDRQSSQPRDWQGSAFMAAMLFLGTVALLALATIFVTASQDSALFPGRKTIHFMIISVPLLIWVNFYLRGKQERL